MWSHVECADGQVYPKTKESLHPTLASETLLPNVLKLKHNLIHKTAVANICFVGEWVQTLLDAALQ